jgi:transglutaminase-like putative cysteine protease
LLLLALLASQLPHSAHLPIWINLLFLLSLLWRFMAEYQHWPLPGKWPRNIMTLVAMAGVVLQYGVPTGRDPGTAMLVILLGLKCLEMRKRREYFFIVYLALFLVATYFLRSQSILIAGYMLISVILLNACLMLFSLRRDPAWGFLRQASIRSSLILAQAMPLMIILFILFPRLGGPLWGLPADANAGLSGLSDEMSPGRISQLLQSDAVAFRVSFDGEPPVSFQRYWRGPVLWDYSGFVWRNREPLPEQIIRSEVSGVPVSYAVTLEPHGKNWLFALDLPYAIVEQRNNSAVRLVFTRSGGNDSPSQQAFLSSDYQLLSRQNVTSLYRYQVISYPRYNTGDLDTRMRERALSLPDSIGDRVLGLAQQWRQQATSDRDVVNSALQFFARQDFIYTLVPPLLGEHPTEEFLFETRRGYCEHYSSAFTVLMRAAGIPARVVTGYQGGELNPVNNVFMVRQLDAHAWSEVWLDGEGWVRIDPTNAVAPDRIELGVEALAGVSTTPRMLRQNRFLTSIYQAMRLNWDAINNTWNQWVLGYSREKQRQFLQQLGLTNITWSTLAALLGLLLTATILVLSVILLRQREADITRRWYLRFCRKLQRRGIAVYPWESTRDLARRIRQQEPELAMQAGRILRIYRQLRYARQGGNLQQFIRSIKSF